MDKEKQIEEMARDICTIPNCNAITCVDLKQKQKQECDKHCTTYVYAKRFYEKGYRKERQGEWVSVEDMLPNRDELVLCIGAKGGMFLGEIKNFCSFDKSAYAHVPNSNRGRYAKYWQPLPQPPKMKGASK